MKNRKQANIFLTEKLKKESELQHQLWLIYTQLKDAEHDQEKRLELIEHSRQELGKVLNTFYQSTTFGCIGIKFASPESNPKSPCCQAADLNCRNRKFNLGAAFLERRRN